MSGSLRRRNTFRSAQWRRVVNLRIGPWHVRSMVVGRGRVIAVFHHGGVARLHVSLRPVRIRTARMILDEMAGR